MSTALDNVLKLAQEIWIDEARWGVRGDGSTDDTAAIQACITANPAKVIHFGAKTYRITAPLLVTADGTRLVGQGRRTFILNQGTGDSIHFQCQLTGQFEYLNNCGIRGFYILRNTHTATAGAGLRLTRCNSFVGEDFYILNCPEGLKVHAGQLIALSDFQIFASADMADVSATANTNLLGFYDSEPTAAVFQPLYTLRLSDFQVSGHSRVDVAWLIAAGDGVEAVNGYISRGKSAILRMTQFRNGAYISPVHLTNVYFDGVNAVTHCLDIPDDGFTATISSVTFASCFFGQPLSTIVRIRKGAQLEFSSCEFANGTGWAIDAENSATRLVVTGGRFLNLGTALGATGGLRFAGGHSLSMTGAQFNADTGTVASVRLEGTIGSVTLTGLTIRGTTADISNTATITDFSYAGNNSDKAAAASSLLGVRFNNTAVTDPLALDWYEEGNITPTLSFGGASTGIAYSAQAGSFARIGNRVYFSLTVALSSKGSATGDVLIGGLPYGADAVAAVSAAMNAMTSGVGDTTLGAYLSGGGGTTINLLATAAGALVSLTDADFTATSSVRVSGNYRVA